MRKKIIIILVVAIVFIAATVKLTTNDRSGITENNAETEQTEELILKDDKDNNGEQEVVVQVNDTSMFDDIELNGRRIAMAINNPGCAVDGERYFKDYKASAPYISENHTAMYPLEFIANIYGAEIKYNDKYSMLHLRSKDGKDSYIVEGCKTVIDGTEVKTIADSPKLNDGMHYIDADTLAGMLDIVCVHDYESGITCFNTVHIDDDEINSLKSLFETEHYEVISDSRYDSFISEFSLSAESAETLARSGKFYYSDNNGALTRLWLTDDGNFVDEQLEDDLLYQANSLFIGGLNNDNKMYTAVDGKGKKIGLMPEARRAENEYRLKQEYMEYKYSNDVLGKDESVNLKRIKDSIKNGKIITETDNGSKPDFAEKHTEDAWNELCSSAKIGDILLCHRTDGATLYGYHNHSALILGADNNTLHLLHSRNAEYGAGADMDIDYLTYDMLQNNEYWKKTDIAELYTMEELSNDQRKDMTEKAYKKFNNYMFGYKYMFGYNEISCAELIREAYLFENIKVGHSDMEMLKALSEGRLTEVLYTPDSIMLNDSFKMKATYTKMFF